MTNSRSVLIARLLHVSSTSRLSQGTQYLASIPQLVRCICRQHKLCTRKTELALEVKFYLDVHWVYMAMRTNADQLKWRYTYFRVACVSTASEIALPGQYVVSHVKQERKKKSVYTIYKARLEMSRQKCFPFPKTSASRSREKKKGNNGVNAWTLASYPTTALAPRVGRTSPNQFGSRRHSAEQASVEHLTSSRTLGPGARGHLPRHQACAAFHIVEKGAWLK